MIEPGVNEKRDFCMAVIASLLAPPHIELEFVAAVVVQPESFSDCVLHPGRSSGDDPRALQRVFEIAGDGRCRCRRSADFDALRPRVVRDLVDPAGNRDTIVAGHVGRVTVPL